MNHKQVATLLKLFSSLATKKSKSKSTSTSSVHKVRSVTEPISPKLLEFAISHNLPLPELVFNSNWNYPKSKQQSSKSTPTSTSKSKSRISKHPSSTLTLPPSSSLPSPFSNSNSLDNSSSSHIHVPQLNTKSFIEDLISSQQRKLVSSPIIVID